MYGYGNSMFLATHGILARTNAAVLPVNTVAPALSGTAQEGQTLTCSTGTWTGTPTITYTYQWKRNGSNIGSATNSTYTLVTADVGQSIKCTVTATNGAGSVNADSNTVTPTSAVDPDAQAFITAASITNPTQQSAINQLVVDLKGYNIWTKMKALYPMVGGTSTSTSYNLKNTSQYQISWGGGVTWASTGVKGNGMNGYGDTGFSFNSTTALSSHISTYVRTNSTTLACEFGSGTGGGIDECFIVRNGATYLNNQCDASTGRLNPSVADARGLILNSRTSNNSWKTYKNSSLLATGTNSNSYGGGVNFNLHLFRRNNAFDLYSVKETAFASIGDGLSDAEAANLYTAVQAFQTTLGRQV